MHGPGAMGDRSRPSQKSPIAPRNFLNDVQSAIGLTNSGQRVNFFRAFVGNGARRRCGPVHDGGAALRGSAATPRSENGAAREAPAEERRGRAPTRTKNRALRRGSAALRRLGDDSEMTRTGEVSLHWCIFFSTVFAVFSTPYQLFSTHTAAFSTLPTFFLSALLHPDRSALFTPPLHAPFRVV